MSIARGAITKPLLTWLLILGCFFGGLWGFMTLGRLEDPAFTIKTAVVITQYPGASAAQVAREVSEPLESEIQQMGEVDQITSTAQPGYSEISVDIKDTYGGDQLPEIWQKLRSRVDDATRSLPSGATTPYVNDSFGDVFGLFYAVTAEGFTDAERHRLGRYLRRELLAVEGVANVDLSGLPDEAIFVEPDLVLAVNQNVAPAAIVGAISEANSVVSSGVVRNERGAVRIEAPEGNDSISAISGLTIGVGGTTVNLADMASVSRARTDTQSLIMRFNGTEAFTLGVAGLATENIVTVGQRVDERIAELSVNLPYGVELHPIYQQHVVVDEASNDFLVNLAMSVGIVVVVLTIFMGWRAAVVVGTTLLLTVVGTLFFMAIFSIEMERISLGALIIAMGMLVDNAIVVAEGMQNAMSRGRSSHDAAEETASKTQVPLLGATVIGIMAFAGIGLSPDSTGEFMFSLFAVIGISLLLSWLLAITVTPLMGHYMFKQGDGDADGYSGLLFRAYGLLLRGALRARWLVMIALIAVTVVCYMGFGQVKQQFFPFSNTPLFFVHYKLPQGTPIEATGKDLERAEAWLADREDVVSVATFVGQGATRFMLTYSAEDRNTSYGHLIIRTQSMEQIPALQAELEAWAATEMSGGEFRTLRLAFGPGGGDPIQARFSGSDPIVLRELGEQAKAAMAGASDNVRDLRTDWREPELVVQPIFATERAETAGITREDVANALLFATDGIRAGTYRENERLIPIIVRQDRDSDADLLDQPIYSDVSGEFLPIEQVVDGLTFETRDTLYERRDRVPTLTVSAGIPADLTAAEVLAEVRAAVEAIPIPPGYTMEWGGEYEDSADAQASLASQLPLSIIIMVLISILLFNALRQPLIIWLLVPMSVNGVVIGLLGTNQPFSFTALLGLLSLSGMLIKNGIVLVEEIDIVRREGEDLEPAIVKACVSRLRPVMLAAATTILGMAPLLSDAFFVSMSVTIMGGLAFATILTLIAAPVLYRIFFARAARVSSPVPAAA